MTSEAELQQQVADYLCLQYPDVVFHSDFGSGVKLTPKQATIQKRQNGGRKGWPDMVIAQPTAIVVRYLKDNLWLKYKDSLSLREWSVGGFLQLYFHGLYIELKKDGTRLKKKNGDWANEHIAEQAEVLEKLRERGYCAEFAVGFEEAKRIIDEYLGGKE